MGKTSKEKLGWQPGQGGEQVGGHGGGAGGKTGEKKAASETLLGKAKAALGVGEGRTFSTMAGGLRKEGDTKARKSTVLRFPRSGEQADIKSAEQSRTKACSRPTRIRT